MEVLDTKQSREEYINTQIQRSRSKFSFCKVSIRDIYIWKNAIINDIKRREDKMVPILCLGTRNGREIDLFRIAFSRGILINKIVKMLEIRKNG